jgi:hypothetical protein
MALLKRRNNGATVAALERELAQFEERKAALEAKLSEANSALVQATDARQVTCWRAISRMSRPRSGGMLRSDARDRIEALHEKKNSEENSEE